MNKYESVCILTPNCTSEDVANFITNVESNISKYTKEEISVENIGKKKLAYEIKGNTEGIYLIINFEMDSSFICELERFYRITEEVMKFITIRKDD